MWQGAHGSRPASNGSPPATRATTATWRAEFPRCGSMSAPGIACTTRAGGDVLIVLLVGGDKASQKQDIRKAQALAADL
jgi:hypothetical protein